MKPNYVNTNQKSIRLFTKRFYINKLFSLINSAFYVNKKLVTEKDIKKLIILKKKKNY